MIQLAHVSTMRVSMGKTVIATAFFVLYKQKQLKEMFTQIRDITGIAPEGSLKQILK